MNKQLKTTVLFEKKHYKNTKYTVDVSQIKTTYQIASSNRIITHQVLHKAKHLLVDESQG